MIYFRFSLNFKSRIKKGEEKFIDKQLFKDVQDYQFFGKGPMPFESIEIFDIDRKSTKAFGQRASNRNRSPFQTNKPERFSNTHVAFDSNRPDHETDSDFYIPFANRPLLTSYEYRYMPIVNYILYNSFSITSFTTFNFYAFLRFLLTISQNPYTPIYRSYTDPQTFFHEVLKTFFRYIFFFFFTTFAD